MKNKVSISILSCVIIALLMSNVFTYKKLEASRMIRQETFESYFEKKMKEKIIKIEEKNAKSEEKTTKAVEKEIVYRNLVYKNIEKDINGDDINDEIIVYGEDIDVYLEVNGIRTQILTLDEEEQLTKSNPMNHFEMDVMVEENLVIVNTTYGFTNKYGTTAWVCAYEYKEDKVKEIWNSDTYLSETVK